MLISNMATKVEIISLANILLGNGVLEPADVEPPYGNNKNNHALSMIYEMDRKELLAETWWSFARVIKPLSLKTEAPLLKQYSYCFALPSYPEKILMFQLIPNQYDFYINGADLYCNVSELQAAYITADISPSKFPPLFSSALARRIAGDAAPTVTSDSNLATLLIKEGGSRTLKAVQLDAAEYPMPPMLRDALIEAHYEYN